MLVFVYNQSIFSELAKGTKFCNMAVVVLFSQSHQIVKKFCKLSEKKKAPFRFVFYAS